MPRLVAHLKATTPKSTIHVEEGRFDGLLPALRAGDLDVLLMRLEPARITGDLLVERLYDDPLCLVCGKNNPLARRKGADWTDLGDQNWVLPPRPSTIRFKVDDLFLSRGLALPASIIEASSFLVIEALLNALPGVSVLAHSVAHHWHAQGKVHVLPIAFPLVLAPVGLVTLRGRRQALGVTVLTEAARAAVLELGLPTAAQRGR